MKDVQPGEQDSADRATFAAQMLQLRKGFFMLGYSLFFGHVTVLALVFTSIQDGRLSRWEYFLGSGIGLCVLLAFYGLYLIFRHRPRWPK